MALHQLATKGRALLQRAAADGTLGRASYSTLPEDLAAAAARARFPTRRFQPVDGVGAAAEAAGAPPAAAAAAAQQAAAQQVQVGAFRVGRRPAWCAQPFLQVLPIVWTCACCTAHPRGPKTGLRPLPRLAQPPLGCCRGSGASCRAASSSGGRRCIGEEVWVSIEEVWVSSAGRRRGGWQGGRAACAHFAGGPDALSRPALHAWQADRKIVLLSSHACWNYAARQATQPPLQEHACPAVCGPFPLLPAAAREHAPAVMPACLEHQWAAICPVAGGCLLWASRSSCSTG